MRLGLAGMLIAIVSAIVIVTIWGPLFGVYGWRSVAAGLMIAEFLGFAAFLEFIRPPNPYSRVYPLYDLRDLGPTGQLHSSDLRWLWNIVPLFASILLLFVSDRWL